MNIIKINHHHHQHHHHQQQQRPALQNIISMNNIIFIMREESWSWSSLWSWSGSSSSPSTPSPHVPKYWCMQKHCIPHWLQKYAIIRNWYLISIQWATLEQSGTSILVNLRPLEGKNREQQFHMTKRASYYWILIAIIPSEYRNNSQNIGMV